MQVFISYSRVDADFAARLRDRLREWGYKTWRDLDNIPQGAHWDDAIDRGLNRSDVVVGVLSPDSVKSSSVKNEWVWALANDRPLILLFYRPCAIPHRYIRINYLDFTGDEEAAFERLAVAIKTPVRMTTTQDIPLPAGIAVAPQVGGDVSGTMNVAGDDIILDQRTIVVDAPPQESALEQRNRRVLIEKVNTFWIQGVLERSLHGSALITLGMQENPDAVDHPWGMVMKTLNWETELLPVGAPIIDIFDQLGRALLILGDPGSGKTTVLLELARAAVALAEDESQEPIPVVFNLSSWREDTPDIAEWLVAELNDKYLVPRDMGKALVRNEELLLLLDGLDEVHSEFREACVEAINHFRRDHGLTSVAICSRTKDYQALSAQLKLEGALVLQPLTDDQIEEYLQRAGPKLAVLREALHEDSMLREMAQSPLFLSIMTLAYHDAPVDGLSNHASPEERRAHLFNAYIDRMFSRRVGDQRYSSADTRRWLSWLARHMLDRSQTVFLVEHLQPTWLSASRQRTLYAVGTRLVGGMAAAAVLSVCAFVAYSLVWGWMAVLTGRSMADGLGMALLGAGILAVSGFLIGVLVVGSSAPKSIDLVESLAWSWKGAWRGLIVGAAGGFVGSLLSALIVPVIRGALHPVLALTTGAASGLCFGSSFFLIGGLSGRRIGETTVANEGIRQSGRTGILVAASTGLFVALFTTLIISIIYFVVAGLDPSNPNSYLIPVGISATVGIGAGLVVGAIGGLLYGGRSVLRHVTLRLILWRSRLIPRSLADFLNYAVDHVFMRQVGGGYIFVHRLLLEHFAALSPTATP